MFSPEDFTQAIFDNNADFDLLAYELFKYQYANNPLYQAYVKSVHKGIKGIRRAADIPFLPISFFKTHEVATGNFSPQIIFESSGTTGTVQSRHLVSDVMIYKKSFREGFEHFYGAVEGFTVIGLLPAYLERENSSLIYMVDDFIKISEKPGSGFYLNELEALYNQLQLLEKGKSNTLLIGVTFALLDFAEKYLMNLQHTIVMETGGMKGRRKEMIRDEVHAFLKERLGVKNIHSEYGMTELLSQAYSTGEGLFRCPPWMKVLLRDENDPLQVFPPSKAQIKNGLINVIDLANIHSCAFIATDDLGKLHPDGSFEVLGRIDHSDLRGCNQLVI